MPRRHNHFNRAFSTFDLTNNKGGKAAFVVEQQLTNY